jgi:hypothetical protein
LSSNFSQTAPFLRTSREFPEEIQPLTVEINKSYIDIANNVNARVIGLFVKGKQTITGESWFVTSARRQTVRQIYTFTGAGNIPHGINLSAIVGFVRIYGTFTDGTNWFPLPYPNQVAANNQVGIYVDPTNIVITAGGGAPPTITSGYVVLEWLVNV